MFNKFEDIISKQKNLEGYKKLIQFINGIDNGNRHGIYVYVGTGLSFYFQSWGEPFYQITNDIIKREETKLMFPYLFQKINNAIKEKEGISDNEIKSEILKLKCKTIYEAVAKKCTQCIISYNNKNKKEYIIKQKEANRYINTLARKISNHNDLLYLLENETEKCLRALYKNNEFLCLGEILNDFMVINGEGVIPNGEPFNNMFATKVNEKKNHLDFPFDQNKSVFLIPYLSEEFITTNVDDSISVAHKICDKRGPHIYFNNEDLNSKNQPGVVHIHGEMSQVSTFIMTARDYDENYIKNGKIDLDKPLVQFLRKISENSHLVFLGASLSEHDLAIQTMEETLSKNIDPPGMGGEVYHHIAFIKDEDDPDKVNYDKVRLLAKGILPVFTKEFADQATFLREALREAHSNYWKQNYFDNQLSSIEGCKGYCKSKLSCDKCPDKINCDKSIFCDKCEKLEFVIGKMESTEPFEDIPISKTQIKKLLCTIKPFLYDDNNVRTSHWRICQVNDDKFCFHEDENPARYNLPLGNTIYFIIEDWEQDSINTKVAEIKKYCKNQENFHRQAEIKVRVIYIEDNSFCDITEEQISKRLRDNELRRFDNHLKNIANKLNENLTLEQIMILVGELSYLEDYHKNHECIIREYKDQLNEKKYSLDADDNDYTNSTKKLSIKH